MEQRKFVICPSLADSHISDVIRECNCCGRFFAQCCEIYKSSGSNNFYQSSKYGNCCHYNTSLVFTDGACSKNGQNDAKAGLGIVIGANREDCLSITVDNEVDYGATRTSQRAELLAAIEGLKNLEELHQSEKKKTHRTPVIHREEPNWARYIVVTDSEYVVKGITEWFPVWRRKGWRTSGGKKPTNLDLFLKLDECVTRLEQDRVAVSFWHIPRAFNDRADRLAKLAAKV